MARLLSGHRLRGQGSHRHLDRLPWERRGHSDSGRLDVQHDVDVVHVRIKKGTYMDTHQEGSGVREDWNKEEQTNVDDLVLVAKCRNNKLVETSATLVGTSALLVVTRS